MIFDALTYSIIAFAIALTYVVIRVVWLDNKS